MRRAGESRPFYLDTRPGAPVLSRPSPLDAIIRTLLSLARRPAAASAFMHFSLPDFSACRVLVCGDVMLDRYWHGATARISPEAPVPVVKIDRVEERPGGAANVARNCAALGAQVSLSFALPKQEAAT